MCSFAVKTEAVHILYLVALLVPLAALQDAVVGFAGIGIPLLLTLAMYVACRSVEDDAIAGSVLSMALAACAIGCVVDALGCLPSGCAAGFFTVMALAVRKLRKLLGMVKTNVYGITATMTVAAVFEMWLWMWCPSGFAGSLLLRPFASAVSALPIAAILFWLLPAIEHQIGLRRVAA